MNKKSISSKVKIKTKKEKHNDDGGDERWFHEFFVYFFIEIVIWFYDFLIVNRTLMFPITRMKTLKKWLWDWKKAVSVPKIAWKVGKFFFLILFWNYYLLIIFHYYFSSFTLEFEPNIVLKHRLNIEELTKTEHDLYMMGVTMACVGQTEKTAHKKERKKLRARYRFMVEYYLGLF